MTPKEKADELIEKVKKATTYKYQEYAGANYSTFEHDIEELKSVALIMVDEIIDALDFNQWQNAKQIVFWQEVKQEIENI